MKINVKIHLRQLLDLEDPRNLRAFTTSLMLALLFGALAFSTLLSVGLLWALLGAVLAIAATMILVPTAVLWFAHSAARGATMFVAPSGSSTPSADDYSYEKALLARGQVDAALASLEARLASRPDDPALCLFVADVYARDARDPRKAERLYLHAREVPGASSANDYLATNRLIDLYMGALDEPVLAAAELEHMRARHAGTTAAAHAEQALRALRH
ncbi:MAG TPA: hypothetical protein VF092_07370 [Longimicrobium sp.]